jgi:hypothetical protein
MKNINLISIAIIAVIFSISDSNAQSCAKTDKAACAKEQSLSSINSEILALERELFNIEAVAQQNNVDLGKPYNYMILNKSASVAVLDEKATAKN